jgi:hypothetical protein
VWEPNPIHVRGMHHPIVSGAPRPFKHCSRNRCLVVGQAPTGRGHPQASTCTHSLISMSSLRIYDKTNIKYIKKKSPCVRVMLVLSLKASK